MKISCSCKITDKTERKKMMTWIRSNANLGYSELKDTVYASWEFNRSATAQIEEIIGVFEKYPEHSISISFVP